MGTTALGIAYPSLTDDVRPPEDMQALAEDVDGLITTDRTARDAAWASYTPSITGATSGTWTAGNATISASYSRSGRTIVYEGRIVFGSTTVITGLSGAMQVSLPVASRSGLDSHHIGTGVVIDNSPSTRYAMHAEMSGTGNLLMIKSSDGSIMIGGTGGSQVPIATFTTSDEIRWHVVYEAATA